MTLGEGIGSDDLEFSIGELNCTSKSVHGHYGMKGQALASLRQLSTALQIFSKPRTKNSMVMFKRMSSTNVEMSQLPASAMPYFTQGTIVRVEGLFNPFPVRKHAVRGSLEIMLTQEFINNMSVLHHRISWSLFDEFNQRLILSLHGSPSVAKRLMILHSEIVVKKLHPFAFTDGIYSIEGLLSHPCREDCSITKDCQYMFVNNRWLRNRDALSKFINDAFSKALTENLNCGPSAKHVKVNHVRYPKYVVKFVCPHHELDLFVEPDKTVPIFADKDKVVEFLRKALLAFNAGRYPLFEAVLTSSSQSVESMDSKIIGKVSGDQRSNPISFSNVRPKVTNDGTVVSSPVKRHLFTSAFLFPSDGTQSLPSSSRASPLPPYSYPLRSVSIERDSPHSVASEAHAESQDELEAGENGNITHLSLEDGDVSDLPYSYVIGGEGEDIWGVGATITDLDTKTMQYHTLAPSSSIDPPTFPPSPSFSATVDFMDRFQQVQGNDVRYLPNISTFSTLSSLATSVPEQLSLHKDNLRDIDVIGQWDNKFILCRTSIVDSNDNIEKTVILAFDQHAVDERINFEAMMAKVEHSLIGIDLPSTCLLQVSSSEREVYVQQRNVFLSWNFKYEWNAESCNLVVVKAIPQILGEPLSLEDMQEFNHYIFQNLELPPHRWIPPAVMRIAASKACRSSIKFGTLLSKNDMARIISHLSSTNQPFQCAHGRPSLVPLMQFPGKVSYKTATLPFKSYRSIK